MAKVKEKPTPYNWTVKCPCGLKASANRHPEAVALLSAKRHTKLECPYRFMEL